MPERPETTTTDGAAEHSPAAEPGPGGRAGGAGTGSTPAVPPDPGWPLTDDYHGLITTAEVADLETKRLG